jgi:hypothetical protein
VKRGDRVKLNLSKNNIKNTFLPNTFSEDSVSVTSPTPKIAKFKWKLWGTPSNRMLKTNRKLSKTKNTFVESKFRKLNVLNIVEPALADSPEAESSNIYSNCSF